MKHNQMRQVVFPILAAFIWGTAFVAQDMCADAIGAFTFNATRYSIAVLALLVVILIRDGVKKDKPVLSAEEKKAANRQLWIGGLCCGAALAIASNFQQAGLVAGTDAGKAGFITALYVVLVPVFGLFFKRKVSVPTWIAVVLSVAALYLLCIKGDFSLAPGDLLLLVCALCFAVHILVIDHFTAYCDGVKLSCLQFLFAAIISAVCMFIFEPLDMPAILSCALPLLYVGIFSCGVGYTLQILAQKDSNPTVVTILLSLESVFAVIAGAIILKQQMSVREYIGCVVMFAAVIRAQSRSPHNNAAKVLKNKKNRPGGAIFLYLLCFRFTERRIYVQLLRLQQRRLQPAPAAPCQRDILQLVYGGAHRRTQHRVHFSILCHILPSHGLCIAYIVARIAYICNAFRLS